MRKLFRIDSPFSIFMTRLFDLVMLNLVFLVCCVPIFTIGASCAALHTVTMKMVAKDEPSIIKEFFKAFRINFRQATVTWLILVVVGGFIYVDTAMAMQMGTGGIWMKCLLGFLSILYLFVVLYIFSIQGRYSNTVRRNLQNALLMALRHLPKTLLLAFTVILPAAAMLYGPTSVFSYKIE